MNELKDKLIAKNAEVNRLQKTVNQTDAKIEKLWWINITR